MPIKIAKEFSLQGIGVDDLIYRGPVLLDEQFLYLVHNSHTWGSMGQSFAIFGVFGALLHTFATCTLPVSYPYSTTPYAELKDRLEETHDIGRVKKKAVVMRIPTVEIKGYTAGISEYTQLLCPKGPITLYGEASDIASLLQEYGLPETTM